MISRKILTVVFAKMVLHAIRHRPRRNRELLDKVQYEEVVPIFLQTEWLSYIALCCFFFKQSGITELQTTYCVVCRPHVNNELDKKCDGFYRVKLELSELQAANE